MKLPKVERMTIEGEISNDSLAWITPQTLPNLKHFESKHWADISELNSIFERFENLMHISVVIYEKPQLRLGLMRTPQTIAMPGNNQNTNRGSQSNSQKTEVTEYDESCVSINFPTNVQFISIHGMGDVFFNFNKCRNLLAVKLFS